MIELKVKNELDLKVFINGFPSIENMDKIVYQMLVNELELCIEKYINS